MNTVLGGAFSSRLNLNLREKHGYTYGAQSQFDMRLGAGPFVAAAGIQTDKTADALKEFFNELNGIRQPVPADELTRAKHYVSLRYPLGFETTGDIASRLEQALVYHLPDDYFSTYVRRSKASPPPTCSASRRNTSSRTRFAVVIAGDRAAIEPGIRALNLGPDQDHDSGRCLRPRRRLSASSYPTSTYINRAAGIGRPPFEAEIVSACPETGTRPSGLLACRKSP